MLDEVVQQARKHATLEDKSVRSVVGTVQIVVSDPDLRHADSVVREIFQKSSRRGRTPSRKLKPRSRGVSQKKRRAHG